MTQLVISVRTAAEAKRAWQYGADVVDLKEPFRGSMGRPDAAVASQVRAALPDATLSMAMGELTDALACEFDWQVVAQFQIVKAAPAGCSSLSDWHDHWHAWSANVPTHVHRVAVAYCDFEEAQSPPPVKLLASSIEQQADGFLLDTYRKEGGRLFDVMSVTRIKDIVRTAHQRGVWLAIAGSLCEQDVPQALLAGPDFIAFRTAACQTNRCSRLSGDKVSALKRAVRVNKLALESAQD